MGSVQLVVAPVALAATVAALAVVVRAVLRMLRVIRLGQPDPERFTAKGARLRTMLTETLGHTRMLKWTVVGAAHWFVMIGFGALVFTLAEAYGEAFDPDFELPLVGPWAGYGLAMELIAALTGFGIGTLIVIRLANLPRRRPRSRFLGSTLWQAYYVEYTIVAIVACIFLIRGFKAAAGQLPYPVWAAPISHALGAVLPASGVAVTLVALTKILISLAWFVVIGLNLTMGVAWHRFAAFFNIFFKSSASTRPALGGLRPMLNKGTPLDFEEADPETDQFGVATVEQFTWKGLLDFTTCTECGRCQSQCPAWNTGKPLSPKLLVMSLRDHAYAKAPYLLAANKDVLSEAARAEADRPLVGGPDEKGVSFAILGNTETCTGDPARRMGNEFVFQMLAQQNVETLTEAGVTKIVATCPHCFNTLANEYGQLGWHGEVVHHTELLAHLVAAKRLVPVQPIDGGLTYHDPCYLGRHNRVFTPPREVLAASAERRVTEMARNSERSFCCGAGGARMWMEERIGKRINTERVQEAVATGAGTVAVGCPFCLTMLSDGVNSTAPGQAEVTDVASVLLRSLKPTG